jgi:hypothetical protein
MPPRHTERRHRRQSDGKFHIDGKIYNELKGRRQQVGGGTAYKTSGGLIKADLIQNAKGDWVSKVKSEDAVENNNLLKYGYGSKKGSFGYVKVKPVQTRRKKHTRNRSAAKVFPDQ